MKEIQMKGEREREQGKQKSISLTAFFNNSVLWWTGRTELNRTGEQLAITTTPPSPHTTHTHTSTYSALINQHPGPDPCLLIRIW